ARLAARERACFLNDRARFGRVQPASWGGGALLVLFVAEQVACVAVLGVDDVGYSTDGGAGGVGGPQLHGASATQQPMGSALVVGVSPQAHPGDLVWATLLNGPLSAGEDGWFSFPTGWSEAARQQVGCGGGGHVQWGWHVVQGGPTTSTFHTGATGPLAALV